MHLRNFSFLTPGHLAGLAYPWSSEALQELFDLGFRSLVALGQPPPAPVPSGLMVVHEELPDFCRIPVEKLHAAVLAIRHARPMVAVCCGGGVGRTGVVLACHLVGQGRSAAEAIAEVRAARPGSIDDTDLELSVYDYAGFCANEGRPPRPIRAAFGPAWNHPVAGARRAPVSPEQASPPNGPDRAAVFLMVRYRKSEAHQAIERALCTTLEEYGLVPRRADWVHADDLLWSNVCRHMEASALGIAVLETMTDGEVSPNVCLELGYMLAMKRPCLLLKERSVRQMQADLAGHLYKEFDAADVERSVAASVRAWLEELGIAKRKEERLLIFVSAGGTCRDPMAKAILQTLLGARQGELRLRVEAMAKGEPSGPVVSEGARIAIQEMLGADLLAEHRTGRLTRTFIDEADLILVMEKSLLKGLPLEKSFEFGEFLGRAGDIRDPWSPEPDLDTYRRCAAELKDLLELGLDRIIARIGSDGGEVSPGA